MAITFRATLVGGSPTDQLYFQTAFNEAARWWSQLLAGDGQIDFEWRLGLLDGGTIAKAGPGYFWYQPPTIAHLEPGPTYEARTGEDGNGVAPDAVGWVDIGKLVQTPNAILALMHEIGHVFAFTGSEHGNTLFDDHIQGGQFVGEFAMEANGGRPVQLVDRYHVAAAGELMYPYEHALGGFSPVFIGMLADSGVPISSGWMVA